MYCLRADGWKSRELEQRILLSAGSGPVVVRLLVKASSGGAPAARGVAGRLASDPSRSCGLVARSVGGACNRDKSTLYSNSKSKVGV